MSLPEKRPRQGIYPDGSILFRVNSERRGENKENTKKNELNREQTVVSIPAARIDWGAANRREKEALELSLAVATTDRGGCTSHLTERMSA